MLKLIKKFISPPQSISEALSQLVPKEIVYSAAQQYEESDLIEVIAEEMFYNPEELLAQVAEQFNLYPTIKVNTPEKELVEQTGYSAEMLKKHGVVPQSSFTAPAGFSLIVSDPGSITIEEFVEKGISVFLSTGKQVNKAWHSYAHVEQSSITPISGSQAIAVVDSIVTEAKKLGALEIFIGHPDIDKYEFVHGEESKQSRGSIHPTVVTTLYTLLGMPDGIDQFLAESKIDGLRLAFTRTFTNTIICATWAQEEKTSLAQTSTRPASTTVTEAKKPEPVVNLNSKESFHEGLQENSLEHSQEGQLVFLVDDDDRFALILTNILKDKGYRVLRASNGEEALSKLGELEEKPELIICDIHMPIMDGPAFVKALKETSFSAPTLMLTSDDDKLLEAELVMLGAEAFVRKQQDPRILLAWCNNLLGRSKTSEAKPSEKGRAYA